MNNIWKTGPLPTPSGKNEILLMQCPYSGVVTHYVKSHAIIWDKEGNGESHTCWKIVEPFNEPTKAHTTTSWHLPGSTYITQKSAREPEVSWPWSLITFTTPA